MKTLLKYSILLLLIPCCSISCKKNETVNPQNNCLIIAYSGTGNYASGPVSLGYNSAGKISEYSSGGYSVYFNYSPQGIQFREFSGDTSQVGTLLGSFLGNTDNSGKILAGTVTYYDSTGLAIAGEQSEFNVSFGEWEKIPRLQAKTSV